MPLDRHQQVARLWNWLPAFRAVAEYESIQRAGLVLAISPSALSRSIKLLEAALGETLFSRSPTGVALTDAGRRLLVATREAMRRVHDGTAAEPAKRLSGAALAPALGQLLCEVALEVLPGWELHFAQAAPAAAAEQLRCGEHDVLLSHVALPGVDLHCEAIGPMPFVLAGLAGSSRDRVVCLRSAPAPGASVIVSSLEELVTAAVHRRAVACVPRFWVPPAWTVFEDASPLPVFLVRRVYEATPDALTRLETTLRARLSSAPAGPRRKGAVIGR